MASVQRAATYVEKGGVGKTTSAAHIAVAAHNMGHKVLLVDLAGTQNDLATHFGLSIVDEDTATDGGVSIDAPISAVFGDDWAFLRDNIDDLLDRMTFPTDEGPDLIPADPGLGGADNNLANVPLEERYQKLDSFVDDLVAEQYDLVIFDLPGKEDNIALNGLFAARNVVAPLKPGAFERDQLQKLDATLGEISTDLDVDLGLALIIPTIISSQETLSESFVEYVTEEYPEIVGEPVTKTADIGNNQNNGRTLYAVPDDELYATGKRAREAYSANTEQLLTQLTDR
ncbi:ParA family protein [Halomicroarcula sp. S1AR25-4]|uniref:ParA family protein n=1 Tax=Haloarcula sp. S1AR25-4 TaxID=2950538 RepID=UPI002874B64E|nr:ParA family protein [Halomicroarcula sp. S1AR25-4]MDS0280361.1 ParA family protein [Halomicroarcula sp. S1AR25-4]